MKNEMNKNLNTRKQANPSPSGKIENELIGE
jgi:hypothetical protein